MRTKDIVLNCFKVFIAWAVFTTLIIFLVDWLIIPSRADEVWVKDYSMVPSKYDYKLVIGTEKEINALCEKYFCPETMIIVGE